MFHRPRLSFHPIKNGSLGCPMLVICLPPPSGFSPFPSEEAEPHSARLTLIASLGR